MYFESSRVLKDFLVELLSPHIGSATLAGGSVVPAVFIGEPPIDTSIEGLEISIPKSGTGSTQGLTGGVAPTEKYEFRLVQHPASGAETLNAAKDVLAVSLAPVDYQFIPAARVTQDNKSSTLDQYVFRMSRSALWLT